MEDIITAPQKSVADKTITLSRVTMVKYCIFKEVEPIHIYFQLRITLWYIIGMVIKFNPILFQIFGSENKLAIPFVVTCQNTHQQQSLYGNKPKIPISCQWLTMWITYWSNNTQKPLRKIIQRGICICYWCSHFKVLSCYHL